VTPPARLPNGYERRSVRGIRIVALAGVAPAVAAAVEAAGSLHAHAARAPDAEPLRGRGIAWAFDGPDGRWVVRRYRRGGRLAAWLGDRYVRGVTPRPIRELLASTAALERGIRTPTVVAVVVYPERWTYRGDIATRWVPDSADLATLTFGDRAWPKADRIDAWAAAGALIARAGRRGVRHADLNLGNILVARTADGPVAWLLDLDRCRVRRRPVPVPATGMLLRFHRSRRKLERARGTPVGRAELDAFEAALHA
jgi:3-deoxy-D-manno-octulosonic acid kinase